MNNQTSNDMWIQLSLPRPCWPAGSRNWPWCSVGQGWLSSEKNKVLLHQILLNRFPWWLPYVMSGWLVGWPVSWLVFPNRAGSYNFMLLLKQFALDHQEKVVYLRCKVIKAYNFSYKTWTIEIGPFVSCKIIKIIGTVKNRQSLQKCAFKLLAF